MVCWYANVHKPSLEAVNLQSGALVYSSILEEPMINITEESDFVCISY